MTCNGLTTSVSILHRSVGLLLNRCVFVFGMSLITCVIAPVSAESDALVPILVSAAPAISVQPVESDPVQRWKRAIDRDDAEIIWKMLPDSDVAITNDKGKTALMSAAKLGDRKLFDSLLSRGLKLRDRSYTGGTVLMYATLGNQLEMMRHLLEETANLDYNAQSTNGWTAIMIAAAKGFDIAAKTLAENGADPWLADAYGWNPLMRSIDNRHTRVVKFLLTLPGVPVDFQNENGSTALHIAAVKNDAEVIRLLLLLDAGTDIEDNNGMTAADIARENGASVLIRLLDRK